MNLWVYDLETYPNFFLACFYNVRKEFWLQFEISDRKNEITQLREFLSKQPKLIGFNNVNFDYPVLHHTVLASKRTNITAKEIASVADKVINTKYSAIWPNKTKVPQLDLFKIWHYDNKNKSTSLKWLEFAMRSPDIRDLPYPPGSILTNEQMDEVTEYCRHDVLETYKFYTYSLKHIKIREFYSLKEHMNLINASEIKIAKDIFTKYLADEMQMDIRQVRDLRTFRDKVEIKDVIFDIYDFKDPVNKSILETFKSYTWYDTSEMTKKQKEELAVAFEVDYKGVKRKYAEGGLHSFGEPKIYESNDDYILVDLDFASFYPHICFKHGLHPEHIPPKVFNQLYEGFYIERQNYPKSDPRNYVLKIILNGSYGLSKDRYSMLYDPKWQLAITINGQLLLTLLTEKVFEHCKYLPHIVFENTDGAMYYIHKSDLPGVEKAAKETEKISKIPLEIQQCKKIIARDVNNYINIITNEKLKFKGAFEIDRDFHKNHSKRIVPIALANYYLNGVSFAQTITEHLNGTKYSFCENYGIYDFCHGAKMTGKNKLYTRKSTGPTKFGIPAMREFVNMYGYQQIHRDLFVKNGKGGLLKDIFALCYQNSNLVEDNPLSKTTRYFVSNDGYQLIKKMPFLKSKLNNYKKHYIKTYSKRYVKEDGFDIINNVEIELPIRETDIESGYLCTIVNKMPDGPYNINYEYYINECEKITTNYNLIR